MPPSSHLLLPGTTCGLAMLSSLVHLSCGTKTGRHVHATIYRHCTSPIALVADSSRAQLCRVRIRASSSKTKCVRIRKNPGCRESLEGSVRGFRVLRVRCPCKSHMLRRCDTEPALVRCVIRLHEQIFPKDVESQQLEKTAITGHRDTSGSLSFKCI